MTVIEYVIIINISISFFTWNILSLLTFRKSLKEQGQKGLLFMYPQGLIQYFRKKDTIKLAIITIVFLLYLLVSTFLLFYLLDNF